MTAAIGVLCALQEEQILLLEALDHATPLPGAGLEARRGRLDGLEVVIASAGVGKVMAAVTATLLVERVGCRALLLSGVAGGLSADLGVGDIVVADRVVDIDYGRATDERRIIYQPGTLPLPGITPEPGYRLAAELERRVRKRLTAPAPDAGSTPAATLGTILSGDAFLASPRLRDELASTWGALAIEMEGSAVCGVAERFSVPWLVVRALSDRAGEESAADFQAFLASAAARSARMVRELLPVLA